MEKIRERVKQSDIGLYLRTIYQEFKTDDIQELADLVSHYFNVDCDISDVLKYYESAEIYKNYIADDFELDSRREEYFRSINTPNPFL